MEAHDATGAPRDKATPRKRRGLTLDQLRVFVVVAEREHVTRAAHDLDLAQSAVSGAIAGLEGVVATRLFNKVGRNIKLTPAGRYLLPRAHAIVAMADDFVACLARRGALPRDGEPETI